MGLFDIFKKKGTKKVSKIPESQLEISFNNTLNNLIYVATWFRLLQSS